MSPVVTISAVLRRAGQRFNSAGIWLESKIATADVDFLASERRLDLALCTIATMMASAGAVDPVIQADAQAIDTQLLVPFKKPRKECSLEIGLAIAIGIFGVDDIGRCQ